MYAKSKVQKSNPATCRLWNQLMVRLKQLSGAPLFIDDTPSLSVLELRAKRAASDCASIK